MSSNPADQATPLPRRRAHSIDNLTKDEPFSRTVIYEAIKHGRLKARKAGRRTIILDEDYLNFLQSLPVVREGA